MDLYDEIEKIEYIIAEIHSIISELKGYSYFEYKIAGYEDDLRELNERLEELEELQSKEYREELAYMNREFERSKLCQL
jgi:tetrahydromethanopterin S-methyltransferase subunit G